MNEVVHTSPTIGSNVEEVSASITWLSRDYRSVCPAGDEYQ